MKKNGPPPLPPSRKYTKSLEKKWRGVGGRGVYFFSDDFHHFGWPNSEKSHDPSWKKKFFFVFSPRGYLTKNHDFQGLEVLCFLPTPCSLEKKSWEEGWGSEFLLVFIIWGFMPVGITNSSVIIILAARKSPFNYGRPKIFIWCAFQH